jgi:hypothetical protein
MTLYTNGEASWTYEQMRDVVFPGEIEGVDPDQFIGGEMSFEDWLAESLNTGIYRNGRRGGVKLVRWVRGW